MPPLAQAGLYTLEVRAYDLETQQLLTVTDATDQRPRDSQALHDAKVVDRRRSLPQHPISGRMGDVATL